jgi:mRNA interferase MazF
MVRGEIFRLRLPAPRGREQAGARYGVIVQADELLALSTVLIAPTSRSAPPRSFRLTVRINDRDTRLGRLSAPEIHARDAALEDVLGL